MMVQVRNMWGVIWRHFGFKLYRCTRTPIALSPVYPGLLKPVVTFIPSVSDKVSDDL